MANLILGRNDAGGVVIEEATDGGGTPSDVVTTADLSALTGASLISAVDLASFFGVVNLGPIWQTNNLQQILNLIGYIFKAVLLNDAGLYLHSGQPSFLNNTDATLKMPADQLAGPVTLQTFYLPIRSADGTYTVTLSTTNAVNGNRLILVRPGPFQSNSVFYQVVNGGVGGGTLLTFPNGIDTGEACLFTFDGTNWAFSGSSAWTDANISSGGGWQI